MKKVLSTLNVLIITCAYTLNAVVICAPFADRTGQEKVVSNNPAVQLGAPNRDSTTYQTTWRGKGRAHWHDMQRRKSQWRKGSNNRPLAGKSRWTIKK